ncbi:MAG: hypothetical protein O7C59_07515 [Rickettsia endosymbiont of Ixodes persulcatus]|nr:hypothetical protein [Rickettsia endosymbiont of Ixodes persulcatus]
MPVLSNVLSFLVIFAVVLMVGELVCSLLMLRLIAVVCWLISVSLRSVHITKAVEYVNELGVWPVLVTVVAIWLNWVFSVLRGMNGMLNSVVYFVVSVGVRFGLLLLMMIGGCGDCVGFGSAGEFFIE